MFNHVELNLPKLSRETIDGVRYYSVPDEDELIKLVSITSVTSHYNKEIFINNCHDAYQWSQAFYNDFDEKIFEDFLSKKVNKYNLNN